MFGLLRNLPSIGPQGPYMRNLGNMHGFNDPIAAQPGNQLVGNQVYSMQGNMPQGAQTFPASPYPSFQGQQMPQGAPQNALQMPLNMGLGNIKPENQGIANQANPANTAQPNMFNNPLFWMGGQMTGLF